MPQTNAAKYAFLYLLALGTLFFAVLGTGQVFFSLINQALPLGDSVYDPSNSILKFGLASVLTAGPLYWWSARQINLGIANGVCALDAGVRRWLTYLILLIAAAVSLGDLIFAVYSYLDGEMTLRVALKVLTILGLAGAVLGYYGYDIRRTSTDRDAIITACSAGFVAAFVAVVTLGFWSAGSPMTAREMNNDRDRLNELQSLHHNISSYYAEEGQLPETLAALVESKQIFIDDITDDTTDAEYGYVPTSDTAFQLCASFSHAALSRADGVWDAAWQHEVGDVCFDREVDEWALEKIRS